LLTHLENWNRYSDMRDRLEADNAMVPVRPNAQPARTGDGSDFTPAAPRRSPQQLDRFRDGFEASSASSTSKAQFNFTPAVSAAQVRSNYFSDGFQAAKPSKLSLGNDNASLTFGAAAAPQDTSFTPTLADVEMLLGGA